MCEKCHELDGRIEQNERISSRIGDQLTVDRIKVLVAELRTQRSGLHPQTKAPNGTTEPWDSFLSGKGLVMVLYLEKIAPPKPLPTHAEPPDVLSLHRTVESLQREDAWLKARLDRLLRK